MFEMQLRFYYFCKTVRWINHKKKRIRQNKELKIFDKQKTNDGMIIQYEMKNR